MYGVIEGSENPLKSLGAWIHRRTLILGDSLYQNAHLVSSSPSGLDCVVVGAGCGAGGCWLG